MPKRYRLLYLSLMSSLLMACMHDPITSHTFKTIEPTAIKAKKGKWVALVPECKQRVCRYPNDMVIEKNAFGCATARNLGMMVSHPKDLVDPEKTTDYVVHNNQNTSQNNATGQ